MRRIIVSALCAILAACGGGGGSSDGGDASANSSAGGDGGGPAAPTHSISGSVSGLAASGLTLQDNGGDDLAVASGASSFAFATPVAEGSTYGVSVKKQPLWQWCSVSNAGGTVAGDVSNVAVACAAANAHVSTLRTGLHQPAGIAVDAAGNLYFADSGSSIIRTLAPSGDIATLAGSGAPDAQDGTGSAASFYWPQGLAVDAAGNAYVADTGNNSIRKITPQGAVSTLAGNGLAGWDDGAGAAASFNQPQGIAVDAAGNVYVADTGNDAIRKITPDGVVSTLAGAPTSGLIDGAGTAAAFSQPTGIAVDAAGTLYVADSGNNAVRKVTAAGVVSTLAGSGTAGAADAAGNAASFDFPMGIAVGPDGTVYVADFNNNRVRAITPAGVVSTLAGAGAGSVDGVGTAASFDGPIGIAVDASGNVVVTESGNNAIRLIAPGQ